MQSYTTFSYVSGAISMGYVVCGLFFLRFWVRTRDGLFVAFAAAFWLLAVNQAVLALSGTDREEYSWVYLLRLLAFTLIIAAIVRKNLRSKGRPQS
ncbi:MAG TPA: DUF5985 family protein [Alphaproteobacteria bacterium]|jgi:hypothetical protein|nr:DUF5985 family protein [Alphaproteobacteria bacterium]